MWVFPMYVPETTHSRYIGIQQEYQIPMYQKKEYIGTPQKQAIPMYLPLQIYQIKQPALPHTSNSKRISAQIIVKHIGIPQNQAIPMYHNFNTSLIYQIKLEIPMLFLSILHP